MNRIEIIVVAQEKDKLVQVLKDIEAQLDIDDMNILFVIEEVITNVFQHSKKVVAHKNIKIIIELKQAVLSIKIENVKDYNFIELTDESKLKALD